MPTNNGYPKKSRTNRGGSLDQGAIASTQANHYSGGHKVMDVGPEFQKQVGNDFCSGRDVSGANEPVVPGSILYFYNNAATVAWVTLSTTAKSAPTGFTDGIPLRPNNWTYLSAGENSFVRSSAATVALYEPKDDTVIKDEN